jgi:hypothetical protein
MARLNWDNAKRRDYVRKHGSVRVAPERPRGQDSPYRRSSWTTSCEVCKKAIRKGQSCYLTSPGVLCKRCAAAFIRTGELPRDRRTRTGKTTLRKFGARLQRGEIKAPPTTKRTPRNVDGQTATRRGSSPRREPTNAELIVRIADQQKRLRKRGPSAGANGERKAPVQPVTQSPRELSSSSKAKAASSRRGRYVVYVIELQEAACTRRDCPARAAGKPHVYVGETSKTAEERFDVHLAGGAKAARVVAKHGVRLRPRLSRAWGPYGTRQEAQVAEDALAKRLRKRGFHVYGGH